MTGKRLTILCAFLLLGLTAVAKAQTPPSLLLSPSGEAIDATLS